MSDKRLTSQYVDRLERTIETLHAEREMILAESEAHRLRAAWREKQRDHLQIELRNQKLDLDPLLQAMVIYHAAEFMGWTLDGLDPKEIRAEFDEQVEKYRRRVGLSGVAEVPS